MEDLLIITLKAGKATSLEIPANAKSLSMQNIMINHDNQCNTCLLRIDDDKTMDTEYNSILHRNKSILSVDGKAGKHKDIPTLDLKKRSLKVVPVGLAEADDSQEFRLYYYFKY